MNTFSVFIVHGIYNKEQVLHDVLSQQWKNARIGSRSAITVYYLVPKMTHNNEKPIEFRNKLHTF